MHPYRARFKKEIVAEFLPPRQARGKLPAKSKVIIFCDGMPTVPKKYDLLEFMSKKGYWAFHPRYRGSWESDGVFLRKSPHLDILDVISGLKGTIRERTYGKKFKLKPAEVFVVGGSFGGPAALLCSLDPRVKKVVVVCPVVDWPATKKAERAETSNKSYVAYLREAFGNGYRVSEKNWRKLYSGNFYNPASRAKEFSPDKILMFHAKDDPIVPWKTVHRFSKKTGAKLKLLSRGGHISTPHIMEKYWREISKFLKSK